MPWHPRLPAATFGWRPCSNTRTRWPRRHRYGKMEVKYQMKPAPRRSTMLKVSEILRVKGDTLFTASPDAPMQRALETMSEHDIGSLVIMEHGELVGMLTFREI